MSNRYCHACGAAQHDRQPDAAIGDLTISLYGDCWWKGQRVRLSMQETVMVHALASDPNRYFRAEEIAKLTGSKSGDVANSVHVIVGHARMKFGTVDPGFDRLENRRRFGYRWRAD